MLKLDARGLPENFEPTLRLTTRPNDANPSGDIFGGWLMSQIDIAGAIAAGIRASGPVVTVAVKELHFIKSLFVQDLVSFYASVVTVGVTSVTISVEVYAQRARGSHHDPAVKVSEAILIYVAVSKPGVRRAIPTQNI